MLLQIIYNILKYKILYSNFILVFYDKLNVQITEFPINNSDTSLYIFIPAILITQTSMKLNYSISDFQNFVTRLSTDKGIDLLRELTMIHDCHISSKISLKPPNFETEKNLNMRDLLRELNLEQLLKPNAIGVDGSFTNNNENVHFGNSMHCAHVKVMEGDVSASAITLITGEDTFLISVNFNDVNYNYSFIWAIYDYLHRDILYVGFSHKSNKN